MLCVNNPSLTHMGNSRPASPAAPAGTVHPHACGERFSKGLGKLFTNRFIPTHVGNGTWPRGPACSLPVHPHACGERPIDTEAVPGGNGSSPRMWGTGGKRKCSVGRDRFIPTHVGNGRSSWPSSEPLTVHPHACGERCGSWRHACSISGSSPRMWGTEGGGLRGFLAARFIPTHVGNGSSAIMACSLMPVHPHACGERIHLFLARAHLAGSSPRMWGTGGHARRAGPILRFIPTHVGNGRSSCRLEKQRPVHPHACGERNHNSHLSCYKSGSSPRMWGTVWKATSADGHQRFIPTHVGNGNLRRCCDRQHAVHPHACGERKYEQFKWMDNHGSSPRMWGTAEAGFLAICRRRFIPTHVGNGLRETQPPGARAVHPHACGERSAPPNTLHDVSGSSPRMWGTGPDMQPSFRPRRFIPTHVGNGCARRRSWPHPAVHPHACGERGMAEEEAGATAGSSPRMWGTEHLHPNMSGNGRFIPTHVGNGAQFFPEQAGPHGSSPRMWGTGPPCCISTINGRFIPTHVGNGHRPRTSCSPMPVHPHACGERAMLALAGHLLIGSSPRMWGTGRRLRYGLGEARFIPTHVGNGGCASRRSRQYAVHPHACGERCSRAHSSLQQVGSSPRMWGTAVACTSVRRQCRFIPTHVGNGFACSRSRQQATVHPHACGERPAARSGTCHAAVHPHACGERDPVRNHLDRAGRFIPTHVGNGWEHQAS